MRPPSRSEILTASLSTQTTSLPRSAKTAPVTSPTYPVPTTQMFMDDGSHDSKAPIRRPVKKRAGLQNLRCDSLRGLRAVVVRLLLVAEVLARIAHRLGQRVKALSGNRNRVALFVPRLPHPLAALATDRYELDLHVPRA